MFSPASPFNGDIDDKAQSYLKKKIPPLGLYSPWEKDSKIGF